MVAQLVETATRGAIRRERSTEDWAVANTRSADFLGSEFVRGRADANSLVKAPSDTVAAASDFSAVINIATLDGSHGFRFVGFGNRDNCGYSVSDAGDVNGDGFDDIVLGAFNANTKDLDSGQNFKNSGQAYLIFGAADRSAASFDPSDLNGSNGVTFGFLGQDAFAGWSVSSAGDVNGDGFDDTIIGAPGGGFVGEFGNASYVVFGKAAGFVDRFDLGALDGSDGFRIDGVNTFDALGDQVSSAGDINGDGFDDIIVCATRADSYVIFGKTDGFSARLDVETLDGTNGFRLDGITFSAASGGSVSSAGDINGDGFDDIIIGNPYSDPGGVDGDGFDDIIIGAPFAPGFAGKSYVLFGKAGGFDASVDLATLDGENGFRLDGIDGGDFSGHSVSSAGDVNGDGFDDIVISATGADLGEDQSIGESYVIFGRAPTEAVTRIGSEADQAIRGGGFDDTLRGKGGNDTLAGGGGHDRLAGDRGDDDFLFASTDADDADRLLDFGRGDDRIALDGDIFGLSEGALAPGRFAVGESAQDANDRLIYDDATGKLFFDADGRGAGAQILIATLADMPILMASDFVVV